jgi:NitT/TauT family transport system substrate-binding protein
MMRKESILAGIVIVAVLLITGSYYWFNREDKPVVSRTNITLAVSFTPLSAPFFIADEKGFFMDEGINADIREYAGGHICLEALLDGKADLATASDLPVMFQSFKRDDYEIVATFTKSNKDSKLISRKSSGITKPEDLEGKKVGVVLGASSQFFFDSLIIFNRLDRNKIEIIGMQPLNMSDALKSGKVDAISIWEPFGYETAQLLGNDSFIFPDTELYMMTFNLIASKNYTKNHPGDVKKILRALDRSIGFIHNNEKESQEILMRRLDQEKGFIEWVWEGYTYELSLDQSLIMSLESEAAWAIKNNLTNAPQVPNYLNYINTDPLQDVKAGAITVIK